MRELSRVGTKVFKALQREESQAAYEMRFFFCVFFLAWWLGLSASASVLGPVSERFEVRVGGVAVEVIDFKDVHYAAFSFRGSAVVEVRALDGGVSTARLQPTAYGLKPAIEGAAVRFTVPRPMALVVQLDYREKLFLFADPPPDAAPADAVSAITLGAVGDGRTDNTRVLQQAIDALPKGGTLRLTAGHYRSGSLRLKSHMRLHLDEGALLQASDTHTQILPIPGWSGAIAFLTGSSLENLSITGAGTIDGNGYVVRKAYEAALGIAKQPGRLLHLSKSKNISIRGITLRDSYSWNLQMTQCDEVFISTETS